MSKKYLIYKVLDLIVAHPQDTITLKEIMKALPSDTKQHTVRSYFQKMFIKHGVVIRVEGKRPSTYRIMRRRKINLEWEKWERKKTEPSIKKADGTMVSEAEIGRFVLAGFNKVVLEREEYKKENKSLAKEHIRITKQLQDRIREQNKIISALRNRVSESEGKVFRLEDLTDDEKEGEEPE